MRLVDLIERFVRYPETLSPHHRDVVSRILASRSCAAELELYYREFYEAVDCPSAFGCAPLEAFLETIAPAEADCGNATFARHPDRHAVGGRKE